MNKIDYLLTCLAEECAEATQRVTKALRFGLFEVQEGQPLNNMARLSGELTDVVALIELLNEEGVYLPVYTQENIDAKKERVEKYMELSRAQGRLEY